MCFVEATKSLLRSRPQIILNKHGLGGASGLTPYRISREHMVDMVLMYVLMCWLWLKNMFVVR